MRGRKIYEPPRFMTVRQCCQQLMEVEAGKQLGLCGPDTRAFGLARVVCDGLFLSLPQCALISLHAHHLRAPAHS